jgi:hypothetical protein
MSKMCGGYGGAKAPTNEVVAMVNGLHAEIATALGADPNAELKVESASRRCVVVCTVAHAVLFRRVGQK